MMSRWTSTVLLLSVLTAAPRLAARGQGASLPPAVEARTPKPPAVAQLDGGRVLVYEVHVTNLSPSTITLKGVEVLDASTGASLATLADSALGAAIGRRGVAVSAPDRPKIGAGLRAIVFMWVPLSGGTPAPRALRHRLTLESAADSGRATDLETVAIPVSQEFAVIGPPLRGGPWLAANGPAAESGHRRALIAIAGGVFIAQRFAIDYVRMNEQGTTFSGDRLKNTSYVAYGDDALAVADAEVVAVKDGIPENVPGLTSRAVPITLETVGGNHVILDLGGGRHAFYAHLQPGSIRVRVGDRVRAGQVLGLVGNSGNSTEPHLHFHVSDANSPLGAEGVPYVHETLVVTGACRSLGGGCSPSAAAARAREMPAANQLVRFP
jgi:murein DD-endopeptidase MepM/ murein hydrolase activator NlpD